MGTFDLTPVSDWRNEGWTVVNATKVFEAWSNDDDTKYGKSPASRGSAELSFPVDTAQVPDGAVITSVTVFIRCRRTVTGPTDVSLSVLSADNEARYTTRTIYPPQTVSTVEVGTYSTDPRGLKWDVHRLNQMRVRVFCYAAAFDSIWVYKVFVRVNYKVRPTVSITAPTGVVTTPTPTLSWVYSHVDGDAEAFTEYKIFNTINTTAPSFNPEVDTPVYSGQAIGGVSSQRLPVSLSPSVYTVYMRSHSAYGAKSTWVRKDFDVAGPSPAVPGNDNAGVTGVPGVGVATVVADSYNGAAHLTMRDASNLLSVQQADIDSTTDPLEYTSVNCSLARETVSVYTRGVGSLKMTTTTAGTVSATTSFVEVAASTPVTATAQVLAAVTARTATLSVQFYTEQYATVGSAISVAVTDSASTWKQLTVTGTSPATAAYFKLTIQVAGTALSEVHYADRIGVMYGTGSAWSSGGHLSRNLLSAYIATADVLPGVTAGSSFVAGNVASTVDRVAVSGTGSHGSMMYRMTYTGATPSIAHRAMASFTSTTTANTYTLNKPTGTVDGDLMVAFVSTSTPSTITPPEGWTLVNYVDTEANNGLYVLKRTFIVGDPTSWAGTFDVTSTRRSAVVVAYSGAAPATEQFEAENVRADPDGAVIHNTATVHNNAANAWRLGAFSVRDDVSANTAVSATSPTYPPDVKFVGKATKWGRITTGSNFTINRPTNVVSGDLMMAYVLVGGVQVANAPTGWTIVRQAPYQTEDPLTPFSSTLSLTVLKRTAGSSEPSSWSGTLTGSAYPVITGVEAFRNAKDISLQFIDEDVNYKFDGTSVNSAWVTNTSSRSLRVTVGGALTFENSAGLSSTETIKRSGEFENADNGTLTLSYFDSSTPVATGDHMTQITATTPFTIGIIWVALVAGVDTVTPGPSEVERANIATGASSSFVNLAVYDSGAVIGSGQTSLYGSYAGASPDSVVSWIGIIKPASPSTPGYVAAKMDTTVDISAVDPRVLALADNKIAVIGHFLGSTVGTPYLWVDFYRANHLISTATAVGTSFGTTVWTKSGYVFDLPEGTTRVRMGVAASDRSTGNEVYFDRLSVALGDSLVWRNGTGRTEHPIWSHPEIQCADDDGAGYGEWYTLPGLSVNPPEYDPLSGVVVFVDHTLVPLNQRKYRVQTVSYGLLGDRYVSGFGPESDEVTFTVPEGGGWWLKDIADPAKNIQLKIRAASETTTVGTAQTFHPFGEDYAVVIGNGYKGDEFELTVLVNTEQYAVLDRLVKTRRTLFLQSDVNQAWWIRTVGDISTDVLPTGRRKISPLRVVTLRCVQVKPEE